MTEQAKSSTDDPASDMPRGHWLDRSLPRRLRPYARLARLDRPIGTWLLLFPCWWSLALAAEGWPDWRLAALFAVGALVMRGAGCTYNDIVDRNLDAGVARTRTRPIPAGEVGVLGATAFLGLQLLIGLGILSMLNPFAIALGAASLLLVLAYPFMKRITWWPQAWLGLTFNWGALLGWAAARGDLDGPPLFLYAAGFFWTLGYDTIYAHQDKEDDALIGVRSAARRLGDASRPWLFGFYAAALALIAAAGAAAGLAWPFYALLVLAGAHLAWQAADVDIDRPEDCLAKFRSNRWFGWLPLAAILAGRLAG